MLWSLKESYEFDRILLAHFDIFEVGGTLKVFCESDCKSWCSNEHHIALSISS